MNDLNNSSEISRVNPNNPPLPNEPEPPIEQALPADMIQRVLGFLPSESLSQIASTGSNMNANAVAVAKSDQFNLLKELALFLSDHIDGKKYPEQKAQLAEMINDQKILGSVSLKAIKFSLSEYEKQLIDILANCDEETLGLVKAKNLPLFFEHFIEDVELFKSADKPNLDEEQFGKIIQTLVKKGYLEKAIDVVNKAVGPIPSYQVFVSNALKNISISIGKTCNPDRAAQLYNKMPDFYNYSIAVVKEFSTPEDAEKFLKLVNKEPQYLEDSWVLVVRGYVDKVDMEQAYRLVCGLPVVAKSRSCTFLMEVFADRGEKDKVLDLYRQIQECPRFRYVSHKKVQQIILER